MKVETLTKVQAQKMIKEEIEMKFRKETIQVLEKEPFNINRKLKKINAVISFEIKYEKYNPIISSLQTNKENLLNKKRKIEEAIKEKYQR